MRDIDRDMAEKVAGWQYRDGYYVVSKGVGREEIVSRIDIWHPSADISQALGDGKSLDTVVGKMKEKGFVLFSLAQMDNETYSACFLQLSDRTRFFGYANIPATAICEAALEAVNDG